jgi:dual specificity protein kinase YAK1
VDLYRRCSKGAFAWDGGARPRRCLTKGGVGNARQDLALYVGDVLRGGATRAVYVVEDVLGCGTFGQVVRCRRSIEGYPEDLVAVKGLKEQTKQERLYVV